MAVLKYSPAVLAALLVFAAAFTLLPQGTTDAASAGVVLRGVNLRLYPAQDVSAEWRFRAGEITYDPLKAESTVNRLSRGERRVDGKLDTVVRTDRLTIDASDNLRAGRAELYIPSQCLRVQLTGTAKDPVIIDQQSGFRGPRALIVYPDTVFRAGPVQASFDLKNANFENTVLEANLDSTQECVDGRLVPRR